MGGVVGFDISALSFLLKMHQIPESRWQFEFEKVMAYSQVAVKHWNKDEDEK